MCKLFHHRVRLRIKLLNHLKTTINVKKCIHFLPQLAHSRALQPSTFVPSPMFLSNGLGGKFPDRGGWETGRGNQETKPGSSRCGEEMELEPSGLKPRAPRQPPSTSPLTTEWVAEGAWTLSVLPDFSRKLTSALTISSNPHWLFISVTQSVVLKGLYCFSEIWKESSSFLKRGQANQNVSVLITAGGSY